MKSTIYLPFLLFGMLTSSYSFSDVPHVFEDGEIIRAEEMNENFEAIDAELVTIKADVENNSNNESTWSEDYVYDRKELATGRDRLVVLQETYDMMQFGTVSFNDHSLFTIKAPVIINTYTHETVERYPRADALDSHDGVSVTTYERRNYEDFHSGFSNRISGYPASINVFVRNYHTTDTLFASRMTRAEFDTATYTSYEFMWGGSDNERIQMSYLDSNPFYETDPPETNSYYCDLKWSDLTDVTSFTWDVTTGTSNNSAITSIDDFESILSSCKAEESENMADTQRVNKYFAYTNIFVQADIELDRHTILNLNYRFDESKYDSTLGKNCNSVSSDAERQACDVTVQPFDRNFSDDFNEQVKLPRKLTREEFVKQLFTLFDHVVISGNNSED